MKWITDMADKLPRPFKFFVELVSSGSGKSSGRAGMLLGTLTVCIAVIIGNMILLYLGKPRLEDWAFVAICGIVVTGGAYSYQKGKSLSQPDTTSDQSTTITTDGEGGRIESKIDTETSEQPQ